MSEAEVVDSKNKNEVSCKYCNSTILCPMSATHIALERKLPLMVQKNASASTETEDVSTFWQVDDMFTFENVGFTLTVDNIKYLSCADCDMGPIGYHELDSKRSFVALDRIKC